MQNKILILNYGHFETYKYLIKIILDQIYKQIYSHINSGLRFKEIVEKI